MTAFLRNLTIARSGSLLGTVSGTHITAALMTPTPPAKCQQPTPFGRGNLNNVKMSNKVETEKSIAEMWGEFQKMISPKLVLPDDLMIQMEHDRRVQSLRQQLLERAKRVYASCLSNGDRGYTEFFIGQDGGKPSLVTVQGYANKDLVKIGENRLFYDGDAAKEFNAAFSFWLWELEQMKGKQNGN